MSSEEMEEAGAPRSPRETLPTMYDLPSESPEDGVPDQFHIFQPQLLSETFLPANTPEDQVFTATDLYIYYDVKRQNRHKRPDWFAVIGVPRLYDDHDLRLSYVIWQEGISPLIVVELLSPGTDKEDLGKTLREASQPPPKWEVYEKILRVPYYVVFDRATDKLQIFELKGSRYMDAALADGKLWLPDAELFLALWKGAYQGVERLWLRFADKNGNWIPTPLEREKQRSEQLLEMEKQRSEQLLEREKQRSEQLLEMEKQRVERLAAKLREMGIDPDQV
jgi:Uma2 family endonuclease